MIVVEKIAWVRRLQQFSSLEAGDIPVAGEVRKGRAFVRIEYNSPETRVASSPLGEDWCLQLVYDEGDAHLAGEVTNALVAHGGIIAKEENRLCFLWR